MKNKILLALATLSFTSISMASSPNTTDEVVKEGETQVSQSVQPEHKKDKKDKFEQRQKMMEKHKAKMFEATDTDKDGKISKAEALAVAEKHFDRMDKDSDGYLTKEELKPVKKIKHKEKKEEQK